MSEHQKLNCPNCGSEELSARGKKHAVYPAGCLQLGLPLAMLHQASSPMLFRCGACDHEFGRRTMPARIAFGLFVATLGFMISLLVRVLAGAF